MDHYKKLVSVGENDDNGGKCTYDGLKTLANDQDDLHFELGTLYIREHCDPEFEKQLREQIKYYE